MNINIVRARKGIADRQKLSTEKQALLPPSLTREIELTDTDLEAVYGGGGGLLGGLPIVGGLTKSLPLVGGSGGGSGDA
jgi:hypothetical protein